MSKINYDILFSKALMAAGTLPSGKVFLVKELFQTDEWASISRGDKLNFGRLFKNKVESGMVPDVEYCGKAASHSAQYKKI